MIIIGGGAAGLFCAIQCGKRGRSVLLIEHNGQVGRKILVSGGGRCNFTNLGTTHENFISANPHFCKSALARYTPEDFLQLVRKHRIEHYEKKLGQMFCRENARQIVDMLLRECESAGVKIRVSCRISGVEQRPDGFEVMTSDGPLRAGKLIIATGGLSYPKIGATDFGYTIAKQFGLEQALTRPSLVALVAEEKDRTSSLAGLSFECTAKAGKHSFTENLLVTHRGLSGPAILQVSNYWKPNEAIEIDLLPSDDLAAIFEHQRDSGQLAANLLSQYIPQRFTAFLKTQSSLLERSIRDLTDRDVDRLAELIHHRQVRFVDTEGYGRAEVTLGGISTDELSSQTMEAKKVPGLFFIGEVVDVTGWLGGYNFQWAWASAYAAASAV